MSDVLKTHNLTKQYGDKLVLDNINISISKGDIYGLIGRNGSGKTTFIRLITGLSGITDGYFEIFGSKEELAEGRKRMGCIIETPALYGGLTAYQNLEYYRIQMGIPNKECINDVLEKVGLTNTGKKKTKHFSLGMKQRLGLAIAILGNPDFIILDEPINGLDPIGIMEMRTIIKKLNEELGITILMSSHILQELSQIATKYAIIDNGKLIKEFTKEELESDCKRALNITVDNVKKAVVIIEEELKTDNYIVVDDSNIRLFDYLDKSADVTYVLNSNGVRVSSIFETGENLEEYFKKLVEGAN